jgi:hypothetical protein
VPEGWQRQAAEAADELSRAVEDGRIGRNAIRAWGPDTSLRCLKVTIFPDSATVRKAISQIVGDRLFTVEVADIRLTPTTDQYPYGVPPKRTVTQARTERP